jgi:hypothetical protein
VTTIGGVDGEITITIIGGTGPYTATITYPDGTSEDFPVIGDTITFNDLVEGSYTITVIDSSGLISTTTVIVGGPVPLNCFVESVNVSGFNSLGQSNNDGIINIEISYGAEPYTVTVAPFLLVYAVKIFNYNNNAKVVCTQPRKQPVSDNSEQISKNIGIPIIKKTIEDENKKIFENKNVGDVIEQNINYIQFKHQDESLTDELYHPYLRLYTDGSLYNIIKQNYKIFIITSNFNNNYKRTVISNNEDFLVSNNILAKIPVGTGSNTLLVQEDKFNKWANKKENKEKYGKVIEEINTYYALTNEKSRHDQHTSQSICTKFLAVWLKIIPTSNTCLPCPRYFSL